MEVGRNVIGYVDLPITSLVNATLPAHKRASTPIRLYDKQSLNIPNLHSRYRLENTFRI